MELMVPREKWTDDRLDDLDKKVDAGFARVDTDIRELRGQMNRRFDNVDARFDKVDERFEKVEGKIESGMKELRGEIREVNVNLLALHQLLFWVSVGAAVAFSAAFIGAVGTHAF